MAQIDPVSVGARVVCAKEANDSRVVVFGRGVCVGDEVPSADAVGDVSMIARMMNVPVPKIELESGEIIYGSECRWGGEQGFDEWVDDREIVTESINEARAALNRKMGELVQAPGLGGEAAAQ